MVETKIDPFHIALRLSLSNVICNGIATIDGLDLVGFHFSCYFGKIISLLPPPPSPNLFLSLLMTLGPLVEANPCVSV